VKRVLFVDQQADIIGGGQRSLLGLMCGLDRRMFAPLLACPEGGTLAKAAREKEVPVAAVDFPSLRGRGILGCGGTVWRLRSIVHREGIDLLHANGSRCMFYAGLAARLTRIPVIWHVRIAATDGAWDGFLGRLATCAVAISEAVRQRLVERMDRERIRVIYNGEAMERFSEACGETMRRELGSGAEYLVGMIARLTEEKDHETFLRAARKISAKKPGTRFLIVGEDPTPEEKRDRYLKSLVAEFGLQQKVIFTGQREDIPAVMAGLDLLIHCAHQEGFGRVLVEGMAAATPVVATRVGGIPEVIEEGETGLLVPPGDVEEVARKTVALLEDPKRRKEMGLRGQRRVRERFSLEAHVGKIQDLYRELVEV